MKYFILLLVLLTFSIQGYSTNNIKNTTEIVLNENYTGNKIRLGTSLFSSKKMKRENQKKNKEKNGENKSTRGKSKNIKVFIIAGVVILLAIVIR